MQEWQYKKVVAHLNDGSLVKGYLDSDVEGITSLILQGSNEQMPEHVSLRPDLAGHAEEHLNVGWKQIPLRQAKALFFVERFEGSTYREVKFFSAMPKVDGLWARVTFKDNETIEGIVHNSLPFVTNSGFFMKPPDPNSNNKMIYAVKSFMQEFRVLGVKNEY